MPRRGSEAKRAPTASYPSAQSTNRGLMPRSHRDAPPGGSAHGEKTKAPGEAALFAPIGCGESEP